MQNQYWQASVIAFVGVVSAWAAETATWEMNTYADFIQGRFERVSLTRDGQLVLAPRTETVFSSDQPVIWSAAQSPDGIVYVGTGHRGRVFQIDKGGKSSLLWTADKPEIFALAAGQNGVLYAGTSPDGKVYRIEGGKAAEYFAPGAKYIWSLAVGPDGALYVGTGDQGKIFRVESAGKGEVYYETGQSHITSMALDQQNRLLAGTEPNGILYRISAKDKAFVLYDANLPEVRAIVPAPDGTIYAAALGGSVAKRAQSASQAVQSAAPGTITAPSVTITVEASQVQPGEIKPQADPAKQTPAPATTPQVATASTPVYDMTGVEKSAIYKINPDHTVETLWSSKEENAYDLLMQSNQLLISTDGRGRVYRLTPDRKLTLLVQTNEGEATRLLSAAGSVLAATSNMGRIYRLEDQSGTQGTYEAPVHDAGGVARWGRLSWKAETPKDTRLVFRTRSGNSARPDRTWSEWSAPLADQNGSAIPSPNARYIQWKAEFSGVQGGTPGLENVSLAYLPQNTPPVVKSISAIIQMTTAPARPAVSQTPATPYTVTVTDAGDASAASSSGTPTQTLSRGATQNLILTWQTEDQDGDRLVYDLYFRGEEQRAWKLLKPDLRENTFTIDGEALADGKYFFRVVASDREVNPQGTAREAELVSAPVMIDNTPPVLRIGPVRRSANSVEIEMQAEDAASPLRRCEYSVDAGPWSPVDSVDGVIDSRQETFMLRIGNLPPGEHLVGVRAADSAGNTGVVKTIVR